MMADSIAMVCGAGQLLMAHEKKTGGDEVAARPLHLEGRGAAISSF
jgi:hypothetical protein